MKLSPGMLHAIGGAGCALILGASWLWLIRPLHAEETRLRERQETLSQFAATRPAVSARNAEMSVEESRLRKDVSRLHQRLAAGNHEVELLKSLSRIARTSGVTLLEFQPGGTGRFQGMQTTIVRITARGTYPTIGRFFAELQAAERLRRITQLHVQPTDRTSGGFDVRLEIQEFRATAETNGKEKR